MMKPMTQLCFNDIFESIDDFEKFTELWTEKQDPVQVLLNKNLFYLLEKRYLNCPVAYETEDEFLAEFGIAYQQYFNEFCQKYKVIQEIYKLTLDDFQILSENFNNFSNNPNFNTADPWEILSYTSQQTRNRAKAGKLAAFLNALRVIPDAQLNYIISKFDYLWIDILDVDNRYLYEKGEF